MQLGPAACRQSRPSRYDGSVQFPNHNGKPVAHPLRLRLLLLAASGLLPLVIVLGWGLDHLVMERRSQSERSMLALSRALATAIEAELTSTSVLLEHMGTSDDLERADFREFYNAMQRTAEQLHWRQATLADSEGRILFRTTEPFGAPGLLVMDMESMRRMIQTQAPVIGRVVDTPKQPLGAFAVRVPVMRGGKLIYVLSAVLPTTKIQSVLTRQSIPEGSVSTVLDQAGTRVARSMPAPPGKASPSLQAMLREGLPQGVGVATTLEGNPSYTAYSRLPESGWVVAIGTSVASAHASLYSLLRAVGAGLAASLGLSLLLAWVVSRRILQPIDDLKAAAAALGRGEPLHVQPLGIAELDEVGRAINDAAADRDRSAAQVKDALRMAADANSSKDQFLAVLGHELRNPLAPIATAVQVMELKGDEKTAQERRIIQRQLVHVTRLVDDLLDVSRITSGRLAIRREPVRLAAVLTQVVETIQQSLYQRSLSLELGPGVDGAWVAGDEVRLAQVFNNLLVNAIKFTPTHGTIRVQAKLEESALQVDVQDTGAGIPAAELGRIFELFYQAPQSVDRARGGLGLGLPIVRSLVDMHGGSVQASSAGAGEGSCFSVRLPVCEAPGSVEPLRSTPTARGAGNVLVVDDNEDAADTCATLLEMSGYTVRVAYAPDAALETLHEFKPDVAILDIGLPGMSGYTLAGLMKSDPISYRGRLIALTGYGQSADMAASKRAGFDAHLTKPVSPGDLLDLVQKMSLAPAEQAP